MHSIYLKSKFQVALIAMIHYDLGDQMTTCSGVKCVTWPWMVVLRCATWSLPSAWMWMHVVARRPGGEIYCKNARTEIQ